MMLLFVSFGLGAIGAFLIWLSKLEKKTKIKMYFILTPIYTLLGWWILYASLPSLAWPLFGGYGVLCFIWWVVTSFIAGFIDYQDDYKVRWQRMFLVPIICFLVVLIVIISGANMFNSSSYAKLIGNIEGKTQKHWSQDIQPLDPTHIRLVPQELAISLARTTLSQDGNTLGSQFPIDADHVTLQKINKDYWYLIPLDYKSWSVWTSVDCVPAYVKISATDPYAKPILVTGQKMKYTPGAWYSENMERILYKKYANTVLRDYSFEANDNGKVFWIITVCKPTIAFWGEVVEGVIIFDPENGSDQFVSKADLDKGAFAWIDRVMPVKLVEEYVNFWGDLKDGWWNSFYTHINLLEAETPIINYSADGHCVIVTPVTSNNKDDDAMTGLMYSDARTGKFIYYTTSGSTEEAVVKAVNSAVSFKKWHANEQIVYENVYGKLSALVPILGENGNYQGLAIVETQNKRVVTGNTPQEALTEFQKLIMSSSGQITTDNTRDVREFTGKIIRLGWDISGPNSGKQYYLYFSEFKNSFIASSEIQSELALSKEGDAVYIKYIVSDQSVVPVLGFKNISLGLSSSKAEQSVSKQVNDKKTQATVKADAQDVRESLKDMSDEQLLELTKKIKK